MPIADLKKWLKNHQAWRLDHLSRDREQPWVRCNASDLYDGIEVVLDADQGGYDSEVGWNTRSGQTTVLAASTTQSAAGAFLPDDDVGVGDDPASLACNWYPLAQHLADVERECETLLERFGPGDLTAEMRRAAIVAGRLHDIGKASPIWQDAALATANEEQRAGLESSGPFAKTGSDKPLRFDRRFFRHELASALALMSEGASAIGDHHETDLVIYLVASHHGRIRLSIRQPPEESSIDSTITTTLGIAPGENLPEESLGLSTVPTSHQQRQGARVNPIHLHGCRAEPLLSYLAGLGVVRLVAEQITPDVSARWDEDHLVITAQDLDDTMLIDYLDEAYRPTPLIAPWNGRGGFQDGQERDSEKIVRKVECSNLERLGPYRDAIEIARTTWEEARGYGLIADGKIPNKHKARFIELCRATFSDDAIAWISRLPFSRTWMLSGSWTGK